MIFENSTSMQYLIGAIYKGVLPKALIFYSEDELLNNTFAKEFSLKYFCKSHSGCGNCDGCIKMISNTNPDFLVYPKGETFQVADADEITTNAQVRPMIFENKIILIENIDKSTEAAQNKILKILEEPPKNVIFVLTSSNLSAILPTIISRCNKIEANELDFDSAKKYFKEAESKMFSEAYNEVGGYLGKIKNLLDGENFSEANNLAIQIFNNFKTSKEIIFYSSKLSKNKNLFLDVLKMLENKFKELFGKNILSNICISEILEEILKAKRKIESNVSLGIIADNLLMQILQIKYLYR